MPTSFPSQFADILLVKNGMDTPIKFKEDHVSWRDEDGNTLLHYAAWTGNIYLMRQIFDSSKTRKLAEIANKKGATALALAIINSQVCDALEY